MREPVIERPMSVVELRDADDDARTVPARNCPTTVVEARRVDEVLINVPAIAWPTSVVEASEADVVPVSTPTVEMFVSDDEALSAWVLVVVALVVDALSVATLPVVAQRVWMVATEAARLVNAPVSTVRTLEKKLVVVAFVNDALVAKRSVAVAAEIVARARSIPARLRFEIVAEAMVAALMFAVTIDELDTVVVENVPVAVTERLPPVVIFVAARF